MLTSNGCKTEVQPPGITTTVVLYVLNLSLTLSVRCALKLSRNSKDGRFLVYFIHMSVIHFNICFSSTQALLWYDTTVPSEPVTLRTDLLVVPLNINIGGSILPVEEHAKTAVMRRFSALPTSGFGEKGKKCAGGKQKKQRFTIAFLVNATGYKEKPIVIWKSANPRCFRGFNKSQLPVHYYDQSNAWMSGDILDTYLTSFNSKLRLEKRTILLLMDNAGCHPEHLKGKYSNIKIVFLPPNTTSKLQPLDLGVIANFKTHYRRFLLQYVLAKIDGAVKATDVTQSINVLIAIRWVSLAWREVKASTIIKCFKRGRILNDTLDLHDCICTSDDDPFEDLDEATSLAPLITSTMGTQGTCSVSEYINGDNDLPICTDLDNDHWEDDFMDSLSQDPVNIPEDDSDPKSDSDLDHPEPVIKNFKEAVETLENVQVFLDSRNCLEMATKTSTLLTEVAAVQFSFLHQSALPQYFPSQ